MSLTLPSTDMLETPPGYPFEEINYEDIDVEEVGCVYFCALSMFLARRDTLNALNERSEYKAKKLIPSNNFIYPFSGGGERSFWGCLQSQMERQRCCNQDH